MPTKNQHRTHSNINCVVILQLFVQRRFVSTDFLALRLFCFNIRQRRRQILYFKLHVDGRKFHYRRPQVVHRCAIPIYFDISTTRLSKYIGIWWQRKVSETWSRLYCQQKSTISSLVHGTLLSVPRPHPEPYQPPPYDPIEWSHAVTGGPKFSPVAMVFLWA